MNTTKTLVGIVWAIAVIIIVILCVVSVMDTADAKVVKEQQVETDKVEIPVSYTHLTLPTSG